MAQVSTTSEAPSPYLACAERTLRIRVVTGTVLVRMADTATGDRAVFIAHSHGYPAEFRAQTATYLDSEVGKFYQLFPIGATAADADMEEIA